MLFFFNKMVFLKSMNSDAHEDFMGPLGFVLSFRNIESE